MTFTSWQDAVARWVHHNFPHSTRVQVALGLCEEVGEVARAVLKQSEGIRGTRQEWNKEIRKEIGDVFLKLTHVAVVCGFDLEVCVAERWAEISRRDWQADPQGHGLPDREVRP